MREAMHVGTIQRKKLENSRDRLEAKRDRLNTKLDRKNAKIELKIKKIQNVMASKVRDLSDKDIRQGMRQVKTNRTIGKVAVASVLTIATGGLAETAIAYQQVFNALASGVGKTGASIIMKYAGYY